MAINYTDTDEFIWTDTDEFNWTSLDTGTMDVVSAVPVVDSVTASLVIFTPENVLSASPVVDSVSGGFPGDNTFTNVKSVIFDIHDAYTASAFDYVSIREIDFTYLGLSLNLVAADFTASATSNRGANEPAFAFDTSLSLTGAADYNTWQAGFGTVTNVRLIIVFDTVQTFDNIKVNNYHNYGADTDLGVQNVSIYTSDDTVTNVNYNQDIFDYKLIFAGTFDQHPASDVQSNQWLTLSDPQLIMDVLTQAPDIESMVAGTMSVITTAPIVSELNAFHVLSLSNTLSGVPDIGELEAYMQLLTYSGLSLEIPISFQMDAGNSIDLAFPSLRFSADMTAGNVCDISLALSPLDMLLQLGNNINATLPKLLFSGSLVKEELVRMSGQFPALQMALSASTISEANFVVTLKQFELVMASSTGSAVDFSGTFPVFSLIMTMLSGNVGNIEATWPMMQLDISSTITGDNDLELVFPELDLTLVGEKLACTILSYVKGAVR